MRLAYGQGLYRNGNLPVICDVDCDVMSNTFHSDKGWSLPRALAFLCCGVHSTSDRDVITDWMHNPNAVLPSKYAKNRPALAATLAVFRQTWPNFTKSQTLHPVIWLWFGVDTARSHLHSDCMTKFVAYIEDNLNIGYRPILRRHLGTVGSTYPGSLLTANEEVALSILVATLPYRPFDKRVADQHWRSERQRNDVPRPQIKAQPQRTGKRSADSPNCIGKLSRLLDDMARKRQNVERLPEPNGLLQFRSLGLKRPQLIALLRAARGGVEIKQFAQSTLLRAMSAVVECKPGPTQSGTETVARKRVRR